MVLYFAVTSITTPCQLFQPVTAIQLDLRALSASLMEVSVVANQTSADVAATSAHLALTDSGFKAANVSQMLQERGF